MVIVRRVKINELMPAIEEAMNEALNQVKLDAKQTEQFAKRLASMVARSYRARVSRAPYNYRSQHPGQWSRNGGRPLEKSVRVKKYRRVYNVYVENKGNVRKRGTLRPTQYMFLGAIKYLEGVRGAVEKNYKKILKKIIANKR